MSRRAVTGRIRSGRLHRLHRIHRSVYAVGHGGLSLHGRFMAAVLASGEDALLSHGSAAALWGLLNPIDGPIHVSVPTTNGLKKRRGIHLHRCPSLADPSPSPSSLASEGGRGGRILTTHRHNIPVTTIQRTIDDIEGLLPPHLVRRAKRQAEHKGIRLDGAEGKRLRSDLEALFLEILDRHAPRLPPPETNVKLGRHEVDFLWRSQRLVVEVDSFTYHRGSVSFHADRARDLDLRAQGFTVLRFSERQLEEEAERVAADVAAALERRSPRAPRSVHPRG